MSDTPPIDERAAPAARAPAARGALWLRVGAAVALGAGLVVLARSTEVPDCAAMRAQLATAGMAAPLYFVAAYLFATVVFVPGTVLTMIAGMTFGALRGAVVAVVAATTGAFLAFALTRWLFRRPAEAFLATRSFTSRPWYVRMRADLDRHGWSYVVLARLLPLVPFNAFNFAAGLLPISARAFVVGSFVGMLPGAFAFASLGEAGCEVVQSLMDGDFLLRRAPTALRLQVLGSVLLLAALAAAPLVWHARRSAPGK